MFKKALRTPKASDFFNCRGRIAWYALELVNSLVSNAFAQEIAQDC